MSGFTLKRAEITGDQNKTWLLFLPGQHWQAITIANGNMREMVEQWWEQGGELVEPQNDGESKVQP